MKSQSCDWFSLKVPQLPAGYSGDVDGFGLCLVCVRIYNDKLLYAFYTCQRHHTWVKSNIKRPDKALLRACSRFGITLEFCRTPDSSLIGPVWTSRWKKGFSSPGTCKIELGGINTQQETSDSLCTCLGQKYCSTSFTPGLSNTSCFWPGYSYSSSKLLAGPPWRVRATWLVAAS